MQAAWQVQLINPTGFFVKIIVLLSWENMIVQPIVYLYWRKTAQNRAMHFVLFVAIGVCLLTVSSKFKVPYYPVPMTLQTLMVMLLPFFCGTGPASAAVAAYLMLGAAGAPVFAGAGAGLTVLFGPTGGFLFGFLLAAALIAFCARRWLLMHIGSVLACLFTADALIFICGLSWLALVIDDWQKALALGLYPFIIGELSKLVLATALIVLARRGRHLLS